MRIITGTARGTKLATLDGENTRPTAERVKESLFSMIQFDLADAWVLDLFGGSGQMGLEAVSRGAERAQIVDKSAEAIKIIEQNVAKTHLADRCRVVQKDALEYLRSVKGRFKFDYVFLDPPYGSGLLHDALALLPECELLKPGAWIFAEDATDDIFAGDEVLAEMYNVEKCNRYGHTWVAVLTLK